METPCSPSPTADLDVNDVEAYLGAREIATVLDAPGVTEYWKSAPYLLSFMDRTGFQTVSGPPWSKSRVERSPS